MKSGVEVAQEILHKRQEFDDPWLLSYADLVTNLLAFFVLLVSMATISFETIDALPGAFDSAQRKQPNLQTLSADMAEMIESEGLTGRVVAELDEQGLAIQLQDEIAFPSGVAKLSDDGTRLVDKIARLLDRLPPRYRVVVEGHTDDVPIRTAHFPSNWALASARALEVRRELAAEGIADDRLSISAYADTRPRDAPKGATLEARRRQNRRVVIRVY